MLFRKKPTEEGLAHSDWISLENSEMLNRVFAESSEKVVVLFKHSTRCSISSFVQKRIANNWTFDSSKVAFYHLDLIKYRPVSNEIAELTGVIHQSPQLLILSDKKVVYHASHDNISVAEFSDLI